MARRFEGEHNERYEVGFGKPPKHAQFKKGQSGNPNGRPKRSESRQASRSIVMAEAMAPITVKINGRVTNTTKFKVMISQMMNRASAGEYKAVQTLLAFARQFPQPSDADQPSDRLDELMEALAIDARAPRRNKRAQ